MTTDILFYIFAALMLTSAICVVVNQNAVNAAMFMILTFVGMAALSVTMQAYFMAILQVLVYGGAIMVLFLFIIMLLGVEGGDKVKPGIFTVLASAFAFAIMFIGGVTAFASIDSATIDSESLSIVAKHAEYLVYSSQSSHLGYGLFTKYMLPVQIAGFLLLVAMIGVIYISKKEAKKETINKDEETSSSTVEV